MNKANYLFIAIIAVLAMMLLFRHAPEKQFIKDYKLQRMYDSSQEVINTLSQKIKDDSLVIHNLDEAASNLGDQYLAKKKEVASLRHQWVLRSVL